MDSRARPAIGIDLAFGAGLAAIGLAQLILGADFDGGTRDAGVWAGVLQLAMTLPLIWRRRSPAVVLAITTLAFIADRLAAFPVTLALFSVGFAFHAAGSFLERRRSLITGSIGFGVVVGFTTMGVFAQDEVAWATVLSMAALTGFPFLLGREVHESGRARSAAEQRAEVAERQREEKAAEAVRAERARIARELHDVVAHEMTVMTIQAAAARRTLEHDPESTADALEAIETSGREALEEMRHLLGLLREDQDGAHLTPQPGLAKLTTLMEQMEEAGLPVSLSITGEPRALTAGIDLSAYRIIQESLTNALKHGGPSATAIVRLEFGASDLDIEVTDDGKGAARRLAEDNGGGLGLVGMRERVSMLSGELSAGPRAGGGYQVRVRIPT
ncbi:MAG: sensor histidine kinase [Acidimicrobiia bacterium]